MSSNDFTMWLNGFFELTDAKELTPAQVAIIKEHLDLVLNKVTKPLSKPITRESFLEAAEKVKKEREDTKPSKSEILGDLRPDWFKLYPKAGEPIPCNKQSPYQGAVPIADWTIRVPYNYDFYTTAPTYVNLPTTFC